MNSLLKRSLTAIIYVVLLLGSLYYGPDTASLFFFIVGFISLYEFYKLGEKAGAKPAYWPGLITGVLFMLMLFPTKIIDSIPFGTAAIIFMALIVLVREIYKKHSRPLANISITFSGIFYTITPLYFLLQSPLLLTGKYDFPTILTFMIIVWANDTGAYFTGMSIGKNKLFERVSPNKTWEGTIGGIVLASIAGCGAEYFFDTPLTMVQWGLGSIIIAVAAVFGDLLVSVFKRSVQVKDTGNFLPGHGGFMDRFDSVFLAAPAFYLYLLLLDNLFFY